MEMGIAGTSILKKVEDLPSSRQEEERESKSLLFLPT